MPDTHDERGGDETPLARVQAFQRAANPNGDYHWPAEEAANVNGVPLYFDDIESLSAADSFDAVDAVVARWRKAEEQLAAATAERGRVNKRADFLDDALDGMRQQAIEAVKARNEATARAEQAEAGILRQLRAAFAAGWHARSAATNGALAAIGWDEREKAAKDWVRGFAGNAGATDAPQDDLSEPVERSETSGGHGEGSNSSTTAAGLSELHAFVVCAACNGSGGYCQRCREGQAGLPHCAHIVTCPDCLGGGTYPPATEDGQHG